MAKTSTLSSDIDVIKEFEELKLKQKLLIESLKRNSDTQQNKLFLEINSKLDFLVKIFTEANNSEEDENKIDFDAKFNEVLDRLSSLSTDVEEKFKNIEAKIGDIKVPEVEVPKVEIPEVKLDSMNKSVDSSTSNETNLPPAPEFETKLDAVQKQDNVEKKKKKWF